jgi:hypothetical protein
MVLHCEGLVVVVVVAKGEIQLLVLKNSILLIVIWSLSLQGRDCWENLVGMDRRIILNWT